MSNDLLAVAGNSVHVLLAASYISTWAMGGPVARPEKVIILPSGSVSVVGYQRAYFMSATFDHVSPTGSKMYVDLMPRPGVLDPPLTSIFPSGIWACPAQNRSSPKL
jgi:hypothetical protein